MREELYTWKDGKEWEEDGREKNKKIEGKKETERKVKENNRDR